MKKATRLLIVLPVALFLMAGLALVATSRPVFAEAGSGGGGGSSGCSSFNYSTCFGAVWRYYKTGNNAYPIKNVGAGYTYATGCAVYGGFFAYVLPHKNYPYDPGQVRSWQIGPVDGNSGNRSVFFGGWTNYRVYSNPSDPIPTNPSHGGDYSWYAVEKAFNQAKSLGQTSGYNWNGASTLGWFCYQGMDYRLVPTISVTPTISEGEGVVRPAPSVNNTGSTPSQNNQWQVTTFVVNRDETVPTGGLNGTVPLTHYGHGAKILSSGTRSFPRGVTALATASQTLQDYEVGTKVCYALSVQPYTQGDARWNHSTPACVTIAKKPKVQVVGSDLLVGRSSLYNPGRVAKVDTSVSTKLGRMYGSWAEYAIIATGSVAGMASGSGYAGGIAATDLCILSLLTFTSGATTGASCGDIGHYTQTTTAPAVAARFPINVSANNASSSQPADPAALSKSTIDLVTDTLSGTYQPQKGATGLTITGGNSIPAGRSIVINAPELTVRITGNITYTSSPLSSLGAVPQVIIIAKNIIIGQHVTQLDAWLVTTGSGADGRVNTCGTDGVGEASALTYQQCDKRLIVNGPVIANHLIMRRTAGSEPGDKSGDPAEVFNLRADAFIWGTNYNIREGKLPTVSSKELPPRF